jgi:triosephosphate isomerase
VWQSTDGGWSVCVAKPLIVGNWKMNTLLDEAQRLVQGMLPGLSALTELDVVLCPPFPWLVDVHRLIEGSPIALGAQNIHYPSGGAFTGEVSARMLKGLVDYVLIGQYERRILFDERDGVLRRKVEAVQQQGMRPILCVGDTADHLEDGLSFAVVAEQIEGCLEGLPVDERLTIAYEPVWTTMGMVTPPPPGFVGDMIGHIRDTLSMLFSAEAAQSVRVIYGGSVTPRNIDSLLGERGLDGVLTGPSSVSADQFVTIARTVAAALVPAAGQGPPPAAGRA